MTARDPLIDRIVDGRFVVEERLAHGGMGVVYEARQLHVDRVVALKVVRPERASAESTQALLDEARAVSRLSSPHTVTLIDVGPLDVGESDSAGGIFIAMELVQGHTLHDELGAPLDVDRAVRLADQIALSLSEAHARGIIHRDLKPANVMIARTPGHSDVAKVVDFGLATLVESPDRPSGGTPRYMAPEVASGAPPDPRGDVYALGLILYEMLEGAHPFEEVPSDEAIEAHLSRAPAPLSTSVPAPLRALVMRCLAKDPRLRPCDGEAFRTALRQAAGLDEDGSAPARVGRRDRPSEQETLATQPSVLSLGRAPDRAMHGSKSWWLAAAAVLTGMTALGVVRLEEEPIAARSGVVVVPMVVPLDTTLPPPRPVETVDVLVHSVPDGATVVVDDMARGETPLSLRLPRGERAQVALELGGYLPAVLQIAADRSHRVRHVFQRPPRPPDPLVRKVDHYLD